MTIKIKHVTQPTPHSCVHACLSMVTGLSVHDLIARFSDDDGLDYPKTATVLTEMGIMPVSMPAITPHTMPICGAYFVSVPSLNLPGRSHQVVVNLEGEKWVLYDPNDGYDGRKFYARDSMMTGEVKSYGDVILLMSLPDHKGTAERLKLYEAREKRAKSVAKQ
jgi:hypothetical protein